MCYRTPCSHYLQAHSHLELAQQCQQRAYTFLEDLAVPPDRQAELQQTLCDITRVADMFGGMRSKTHETVTQDLTRNLKLRQNFEGQGLLGMASVLAWSEFAESSKKLQKALAVKEEPKEAPGVQVKAEPVEAPDAATNPLAVVRYDPHDDEDEPAGPSERKPHFSMGSASAPKRANEDDASESDPWGSDIEVVFNKYKAKAKGRSKSKLSKRQLDISSGSDDDESSCTDSTLLKSLKRGLKRMREERRRKRGRHGGGSVGRDRGGGKQTRPIMISDSD